MNRHFRSVAPILLVVVLALTMSAAAAEPTAPEIQQHLVMAHAKWQVVDVILHEMDNPAFQGDDHYRSAINYLVRHVTTIAGPALNRWVIRPERRYFPKELVKPMEEAVYRLKGFGMGIMFCNSPDLELWKGVSRKMHDTIRETSAGMRALFRRLPNPNVELSAENRQEVVCDQLRMISAFLINQDENHRWTPGPDGEEWPRPDEVKRVLVLHCHAINIAAAMIATVVAQKDALRPSVSRQLIRTHRYLEKAREIGLKAAQAEKPDWELWHRRFHDVFSRAYNEVDDAWGKSI